MNFSKISSQTTIGRLLRFPLKMIPNGMILPILQGPLFGKVWITGTSDHGCWLGSYEFDKQRLFARYISPGDIVYDIGAHVGFYTLLASTIVGKQGYVIAFEPVPNNIVHLNRHLKLNRIRNVRIVEAAVSDSIGKMNFNNGITSSTGRISRNTNLSDYQVSTVTLDALISKEGFPIPKLIKIDIEGGEFHALKGAETLLRQYHPIILLATHGDAVHKNCLDHLNLFGYKLISLNGKNINESNELIAL